VTEIERLGPEAQVTEVAQMMGGPTGGAAAEASARDLLGRAVAWASASRAASA
jgi:DNA repair ATPase RecN